jgi:hypothetical protein
MLLTPLPPPQQMPAPTEGMQSVRVEDSLPPEPVPAVQIATPVQVEEEGAPAPARVAKPSGGQIGPRKQYGEATRASKRTAAAAPSPPPPKRSLRHAETNAEPTDDRTRRIGRAATAAKAEQAQRKYEEIYRDKVSEYDDAAYEAAAIEENKIMAMVYEQCVEDVTDMMAIRKQDVQNANKLDLKSVDKVYVSTHDDNTARALAALLRTLAAGKEFTDTVTIIAIGHDISAKKLTRHFNEYMEQGILPHSARGQHAKVLSWLDDKSIRMCCVSWLDRKKAFKIKHPKKPERHWLAADFKDHVNEVLENTTLLPEGEASPTISLRTAMRWLVKLG